MIGKLDRRVRVLRAKGYGDVTIARMIGAQFNDVARVPRSFDVKQSPPPLDLASPIKGLRALSQKNRKAARTRNKRRLLKLAMEAQRP